MDRRVVGTSIVQEQRWVVRGFLEDHLGRETVTEDYRRTREFERRDAAEAYRDFLDKRTLLEAYEIEGHGTCWEVSTTDHRWVATVDTRAEAEKWGATTFHTLEEWYASPEYRESIEEARIEDRLLEERDEPDPAVPMAGDR